MQRKDFEIMAPVGSRDSLAAAIQAGADSIYFGIENLNMRAHSAKAFTIHDLKEIAAISPAARVAVIREATKLHEEIIRGSAAEVAAIERQWKGEIVVGVYPGKDKDDADNED